MADDWLGWMDTEQMRVAAAVAAIWPKLEPTLTDAEKSMVIDLVTSLRDRRQKDPDLEPPFFCQVVWRGRFGDTRGDTICTIELRPEVGLHPSSVPEFLQKLREDPPQSPAPAPETPPAPAPETPTIPQAKRTVSTSAKDPHAKPTAAKLAARDEKLPQSIAGLLGTKRTGQSIGELLAAFPDRDESSVRVCLQQLVQAGRVISDRGLYRAK